MRHFLFLLAATGLTLPALAQTERGSKLIGVSVGELSYTKFDNGRTRLSAAVTPAVGWFVANNLAVGTGIRLSYSRSKFNGFGTMFPVSTTSRSFGYGLAPFARYYLPGSGKHRVFAHVSAEHTWFRERTKYEEGPNTNASNSFPRTWAAYGGLGYNYFLTPTVALEAQAGYRRSGYFNDRRPATGELDARVGLSVFLPSGRSAAAPTE
jgi:outer membrane protein